MKRNESILVYGVTGLLLLILFIAVVFGDGPAPAGPAPADDEVGLGDEAQDIRDFLNLDESGALGDSVAAGGAEAATGDAGAALRDLLQGTGALAAGPDAADPAAVAAAELETGALDPVAPAVTPAAPLVPAPTGVAAAGAAESDRYALSARVGDYRQVVVQPGDSFSMLVQRWCGSLDQLPLAEALNEDIDRDRLRPGRRLLLPWVDEAVLQAVRKERQIVASKQEAASGSTYEIKSGDNLWKIAMQATGSDGRVPSFIQRVLELNPGLAPERLRPGQRIVLPRDE